MSEEYFIDCYEWFCPEGCDRQDCPIDMGKCLVVVTQIRIYPACGKLEKRVYMRASLGDLTENEIKIAFPGLNKISIDIHIVVRRSTDIPLNTPSERLDHSMLLDRFEAVRATDRLDLPEYKRQQTNFVANHLLSVADRR